MSIPIQKIINDQLVPKEDKKEIKSWHPSKIGSCPRGVYFERLGVKPDSEFDERTLRVFNAGNIFEDWVMGLLEKDDKLKITKQVRAESKELDITGYADAILEWENEKKVLECKSKHSRAFWYMEKKGEGANRHHEYQLWIYLKLLNIDEGSLLYVSKDDLTLLEYPVKLSDKKLEKETIDYINLLNEAWEKQDPTILPLPNENDWQAKYCRYHSHCINCEK